MFSDVDHETLVSPVDDDMLDAVDVATLIPTDAGDAQSPQLLADGSVAYLDRTDFSTVIVQSRDGSVIEEIDLPTDPRNAEIDPTGRYVYYSLDSTEEGGLYRYAIPDGPVEQLIEFGDHQSFLGFSFDQTGERLTYTLAPDGTEFEENLDLYVANPDATDARIVDTAVRGAGAFSPDGTSIAYSHFVGDVDGWPTTRIAVLDLASTDPDSDRSYVVGEDTLGLGRVLAWLPDGRIVYSITAFTYMDIPTLGVANAP